ncbi:hypothetical protein EVAR_13605_1 [Eumeta japonica]|uniref:Uncharacterized protein n=1 Tax=Eumeta variegata TaxID=151549 RepID=A0A4C1UUL2_EUMVA|nr:hypothetical protein EVAR_13605_1 [Eumeta japonica]
MVLPFRRYTTETKLLTVVQIKGRRISVVSFYEGTVRRAARVRRGAGAGDLGTCNDKNGRILRLRLRRSSGLLAPQLSCSNTGATAVGSGAGGPDRTIPPAPESPPRLSVPPAQSIQSEPISITNEGVRLGAIKDYLKRGLQTFFGVQEDNEVKEQEVWKQRRYRLAERTLGDLRADHPPDHHQDNVAGDEFRDGRSFTAVNTKNNDVVLHVIRTDRHVTYPEIGTSLGIAFCPLLRPRGRTCIDSDLGPVLDLDPGYVLDSNRSPTLGSHPCPALNSRFGQAFRFRYRDAGHSSA